MYEKPIIYNSPIQVLESLTAGLIGGYVWNKVWKASLIRKIRFDPKYAMNEDALFSWKVLKNCNNGCYIPINLYHYRVFNNSSTRKVNVKKSLEGLEVFEKMYSDSKSFSEKCKLDLGGQVLCRIAITGFAMYKNKDFSKSVYLQLKYKIKFYKKYINKVSLSVKIQLWTLSMSYKVFCTVCWIKEKLKRSSN